jgi:hypothetical protein
MGILQCCVDVTISVLESERDCLAYLTRFRSPSACISYQRKPLRPKTCRNQRLYRTKSYGGDRGAGIKLEMSRECHIDCGGRRWWWETKLDGPVALCCTFGVNWTLSIIIERVFAWTDVNRNMSHRSGEVRAKYYLVSFQFPPIHSTTRRDFLNTVILCACPHGVEP